MIHHALGGSHSKQQSSAPSAFPDPAGNTTEPPKDQLSQPKSDSEVVAAASRSVLIL